jgi:hypothetical protein
MTFPIPNYTFEERQLMELVSLEYIGVNFNDGYVVMRLNEFREINWFFSSDYRWYLIG